MTATTEATWYTTGNEKLFRSIVEHCADAIVAIDGTQRIVLFNRAASALFGYRPEDALGRPIDMLLPEPARQYHADLVSGFAQEHVRARYMADRRADISGLRADGTEFPAGISILRSHADERLIMVAIVRDRTEQRRLQKSLEKLANTDPLTGALNRRAFDANTRAMCEAAARERRHLALLMMDIDHFKALNDTHGHTVGDLAIVEVFERFAGSLRGSDLLGRWGGEEFVALLADSDLEGARATAERVRARVADTPISRPESGHVVQLTASFGVAVFRPGEDTPETLVARADDALYRAKREGRNRVRAAEDAEG